MTFLFPLGPSGPRRLTHYGWDLLGLFKVFGVCSSPSEWVLKTFETISKVLRNAFKYVSKTNLNVFLKASRTSKGPTTFSFVIPYATFNPRRLLHHLRSLIQFQELQKYHLTIRLQPKKHQLNKSCLGRSMRTATNAF